MANSLEQRQWKSIYDVFEGIEELLLAGPMRMTSLEVVVQPRLEGSIRDNADEIQSIRSVVHALRNQGRVLVFSNGVWKPGVVSLTPLNRLAVQKRVDAKAAQFAQEK